MTTPQQSSLIGVSASALTAHLTTSAAWDTVFDSPLSLRIPDGMAGNTVRVFISYSVFGGAASRMRLSFYGPRLHPMQFLSCYIGHQSGTGFGFAETPAQVTFNGGASGVTIGTHETKASDPVNFAYDGSRSVILSFYIPWGTESYGMSVEAGETDFATAYKSTGAIDDSATLSGYGYDLTGGWSRSALQSIEVTR